MPLHAIGCLEVTSIAKGFEIADAMVKAAQVEILINRSICPGKYMILVSGETDAVRSSLAAGETVAGDTEIDQFLIPNVHPQVFPAITGTQELPPLQALGIIETFSVASLIEAADAAVKAAEVTLLQLHLAMAIGGKAYCTLTGDVAAVEAAVAAGVETIRQKGLLVEKVVIPQPDPQIFQDRL